MDDGCLEGGCLCVDRVKVEGVVVARQLGEQLNITGGECFGEGGSLSDVEQPTGGRSCSDRREAETRGTNDTSPHETHPEENCDPPPTTPSVQLQLPTVSCQCKQERRYLRLP